ncbi:hypothetical protein AQZ49_14375 [Novosphingobium sp. FSW06-99]|nr:hypothetical protein AQZ49_14375 [Novosphingobium sp. FSW06-99]
MRSFDAQQQHTMDWKCAPATKLESTIAAFKAVLPGWWFSLGESQLTAYASYAPTGESEHIALIPVDKRFDSGFHADLPQPATLSAALLDVLGQALAAIQEAEEAEEAST